MRIAHKYHWHYAPPIYLDGDTQLWCQWCGFHQTIKRAKHYTSGCGQDNTQCTNIDFKSN